MLKTINEAKNYAIDRISQIEGEDLIETEKLLVQTELENLFLEKLSKVISNEEIEQLQAENQEDLEWKLFYKVPNYSSLLEDTTAEFLTDYLSSDEEDDEE